MKQILSFTMALLLVTGCTLTSPFAGKVNTANKGFVVAVAEIRAANLLLQQLIQDNHISQADAQLAKDRLDEALTLVEQSKAAVAAGEQTEGQTALQSAVLAIDAALLILGPAVDENSQAYWSELQHREAA